MPDYGVVPGTGTAVLLQRLARPYDPERVASALLGLPPRVTRQLVGAVLATSAEAEGLLSAMPSIVRSMAIATTDRAERCVGEIRGPVLWAETMSARSSSAGDPGLFVCATTTKAYDTAENRTLKAALDVIRRAGRHADVGTDGYGDDVIRRARHNGQQAARLLEHQTLSQVPVTRPNGRMLQRTRNSTRRHTYRPALAMLQRAGQPLGPADVSAFADERTRAQHDLLAATLQHLEGVTGERLVLRSDHGGLSAGRVTFHHPGGRGDAGHLDGIEIDGVLLDVPSPLHCDVGEARALLQGRGAGRRTVLALGADDVEAAVALALGQ
ncbi:MAG: hypothetical protein ABIP36_03440 [Acidimicrobiales bacterium]